MKKIMSILSMAALVFLGAMTESCESLVDDQKLANNGKVTLTATVSLPDGNGTKALADPGDGTLTKTFAVDDQISVRYQSEGGAWIKVVSEKLKSTDIERDGKRAKFTITLTEEPLKGTNANYVTYIYPASIATNDGMVVNSSILSSQDGTLASLASSLDACINSAKWDGSSTLPNLTLENQFAIGKFTFGDGTNDNINDLLTGVTINVDNADIDDKTYVITPSSGTFTSDPSYVALDLTNTNGTTVTITATTATGTYQNANTITSAPSQSLFNAGYMYTITAELAPVWDGDLSKITSSSTEAFATATDGMTITGTLGYNKKISIADGATVILNNATISYSSNGADYAGLTLLGDGTIVLADGTTNTIIGGLDGSNYSNWPGIFVPEGKTLTINGNTGVLNAARGLPANDEGSPAGIGAAWGSNCGNIVINGGVINATGGNKGAGIGGCGRRGCGNITINGGTVTATGGDLAAGIGLGGTNNSSYADGGTCGDITISGGIIIATGGEWGAGIGTGFSANTKNVTVTKTCGNILISGGTITATGGNGAAGIGTGKTNTNGIINIGTITITNGVTLVTATKGTDAPNSIGKGSGTNITCGTVTIGGVTGAISTSPYTYPAPAAASKALSSVTSSEVGWRIGSDGNAYEPTGSLPTGVAAVAAICYVGVAGSADASSASYKGLALALTDANSGDNATWCSETAGATCLTTQYTNEYTAKDDIAGIANTNALVNHGSHTHPAASAARNYNSGTHPTGTSEWFLPSVGQWHMMITAAGNYATLVSNASLTSNSTWYWLSTEYNGNSAWMYTGSGFDYYGKSNCFYIRACLAF